MLLLYFLVMMLICYTLNYFYIMKLICAVSSISLVSIALIRYYFPSPDGLTMFRFKRFLMLLLCDMFVRKADNFKFQLFIFSFKVVIKDSKYYVYQLKSNKVGQRFDLSSNFY